MWPFKKRQSDTENVPQEVQDYYQAEQRDRSGMAWLLALGTLLITIALALGLFFGGRWAYRAIFQDDETAAPTENIDDSSDVREDLPGADGTGQPGTEDPTTEQDQNGAGTEDQNQGQSGGPTPPVSVTTPPASEPETTPNAGNLPDTGPGSTMAVFLGVTFVAYALHFAVTAAKPRT